MNLSTYIENVEGKIEGIRRNRASKVEAEIVTLVAEKIAANEPTTIKSICDALSKPPQQIHQILKKSGVLTKVKVKGRTLVVPTEMGSEDEGTE